MLSASAAGSVILLRQQQNLGQHGGHGFHNKHQSDGQVEVFPEYDPEGDMTTANPTALPTAAVAAGTATQPDTDGIDKMLTQVLATTVTVLVPRPSRDVVDGDAPGNPMTQTQPWNPNKSPDVPGVDALAPEGEARIMALVAGTPKQPDTDFIHKMRATGVPEYDPTRDKTTAAPSILPTAGAAGTPKQPDTDFIDKMRTVSTRTITLIIPTAAPVPTSPGGFAGVEMLTRGGQDSGEGEDKDIEQLAPGKTRTITLIEMPTGLVVSPKAQTPVDGVDYEEIARIAELAPGKTRSVTLIEQPTGLAVSPDTKELALDSAPTASGQINQHGYGAAILHTATAAMGRKQAISDRAIWFFLASFAIFMTGVAWNIYVHVGMERERKLAMEIALSEQELGKGGARGGGMIGNDRGVQLAVVPPAGERLGGSLV